MKINYLTETEILDYEKEVGYELVVSERPAHYNLPRFYVHFEHGEVMANNCLASEYGNGKTIDEALYNYCKKISNKKIAFDAFTDHRKNIDAPRLIHTKLLGK